MTNRVENVSLPEGWSVKIICTLEEIEHIRPIWETMQAAEPYPVINADIDRYLSVLKASDNKLTPIIVLLEQNDQPKAMLIGRKEKHTIPVRIGYKTVLKPKLNSMTVVYGGVLGRPDDQVSIRLLGVLKMLLRMREFDAIHFNHLRIDTPFYNQLRRSQFWSRNLFPVVQPHWRMSMPPNLDTFFSRFSKKHRSNLKRAIRNFKDKYQDKIKIIMADQHDLEFILKDAEKISTKTYQHTINAGFVNGPLMHSILTKDSELNRTWLSILYVDTVPCAFQWGTAFRNVYFLEKIGFDPDWSQQSVGNILFISVLEQLCAHKELDYLDFGFGDAQYKQSYGDEFWSEAAATYLFAPRIYPLMVNLINSVNTAVTLSLLWAAKKCGLYHWIKRTWRRKFARSAV